MKITAHDTRVKSNEGFLLADAVIMRTGPHQYLRGEIGLEGDPMSEVTLNRSRKAVQDALDGMIGAPVTIGHPRPFIDATDATSELVGAIVTKPELTNDGKVTAKLRVYDADAVKRIESGVDELSPGYIFTLDQMHGDKGEIQGMKINHIAIVPKGRAGASVRIMDSLPPNNLHEKETCNMNDETKRAIDEAVAAAVRRQTGDSGAKIDTGAMVKAITDSLKPALEDIDKIKKVQDEAVAAAEKKAADEQAKKARDELIEETVANERARYSIIELARPFIAEDQHESLFEKEAKDILALALGDKVKNAADQSIDYLRGKLEGIRESGSVQVADQATPPGVMQATDRSRTQYKNPIADVYKKRYDNRHSVKGGSE